MPSSGYPSAGIFQGPVDSNDPVQCAEFTKSATYVIDCAEAAMRAGLFCEWLDWFVGAWNQTHDPLIAASAGIDEWDI